MWNGELCKHSWNCYVVLDKRYRRDNKTTHKNDDQQEKLHTPTPIFPVHILVTTTDIWSCAFLYYIHIWELSLLLRQQILKRHDIFSRPRIVHSPWKTSENNRTDENGLGNSTPIVFNNCHIRWKACSLYFRLVHQPIMLVPKLRNHVKIHPFMYPYSEPMVIQWQSSGNPVWLELIHQWTLECHWGKICW